MNATLATLAALLLVGLLVGEVLYPCVLYGHRWAEPWRKQAFHGTTRRCRVCSRVE